MAAVTKHGNVASHRQARVQAVLEEDGKAWGADGKPDFRLKGKDHEKRQKA